MQATTQTLEDLKAELHTLIDGVADKDQLTHVLEVVNDILDPVVDIPLAHKDELDRRMANFNPKNTIDGKLVFQRIREKYGYDERV